jgi:hypothetical protein
VSKNNEKSPAKLLTGLLMGVVQWIKLTDLKGKTRFAAYGEVF